MILASGFVLGIVSYAGAMEALNTDFALNLLRNNALAITQLHLLKIEELTKLEHSIAFDIALRMDDLHKIEQLGELQPEQHSRLSEMRVVLSIMQERDGVTAWHANTELQNRLNSARRSSPELVKKYDCYDWSQPMWVSVNCNS